MGELSSVSEFPGHQSWKGDSDLHRFNKRSSQVKFGNWGAAACLSSSRADLTHLKWEKTNVQSWDPQHAAGFTVFFLVLLINTEPWFVLSAVSTQVAEKSSTEFSGSKPWVCVRKVSLSCYISSTPSQSIPGTTWSSLCSTDQAAAAVSGFHFSSFSRC